jgi:hypothetical protein
MAALPDRNKQQSNSCRNSQTTLRTHRRNELIDAVRPDRAVQHASGSTVDDSRENICPYKSSRYVLITCDEQIAAKDILGFIIVVSCACELILSLSAVFYLVRTVQIFGFRLVTDRTRDKRRQLQSDTYRQLLVFLMWRIRGDQTFDRNLLNDGDSFVVSTKIYCPPQYTQTLSVWQQIDFGSPYQYQEVFCQAR